MIAHPNSLGFLALLEGPLRGVPPTPPWGGRKKRNLALYFLDDSTLRCVLVTDASVGAPPPGRGGPDPHFWLKSGVPPRGALKISPFLGLYNGLRHQNTLIVYCNCIINANYTTITTVIARFNTNFPKITVKVTKRRRLNDKNDFLPFVWL